MEEDTSVLCWYFSVVENKSIVAKIQFSVQGCLAPYWSMRLVEEVDSWKVIVGFSNPNP